jgi:hypothetical protein
VTTFSAKPTLSGLKPFQKRTVNHVYRRFYTGSQPTDRFLVADETGLGKSVVAAGIVARAIEHLEDHDSVDRIDVVYMCSNQDLAKQNIARVNVTRQADVIESGRLTLLPLELGRLNAKPGEGTGKRVNFISLTPGTSFNDGQRLGNAEERAVLFLMLERVLGKRESRTEPWRFPAEIEERALELLRGNSGPKGFVEQVNRLGARHPQGIPRDVVASFRKRATEAGLLNRFRRLLRSPKPTSQLREDMPDLIRDLRSILAEAGLEALEPDLIILDEFQRFQDLLYGSKDDTEVAGAAELARKFLDYDGAKLLLLSATPYRAHTSGADEGEDHAEEFLELLGFLSRDEPGWISRLERLLAQRRRQLAGIESGDNAEPVEAHLKRFMCRTERPQLGEDDMLHVVHMQPTEVFPGDLRSLAALTAASRAAKAGNPIEYWKSVPYFANFLSEYQLGKVIDGTVIGPREEVRPHLPALTVIDPDAHRSYGRLEGDNAKIRAVERHVLDSGLWRLLWMPPSCPYTRSAGAYAEIGVGATKQVIFSAWSATPNAVSTLLSYEAERRIMARTKQPAENSAEARARFTGRLNWRMRDGEPTVMSGAALFIPHASLAALTDPLVLLADAEGTGTPSSSAALIKAAEFAVRASVREADEGDERGLWAPYFGVRGALPRTWSRDQEAARAGIAVTATRTADGDHAASPEPHSDSLFMLHADRMLKTVAAGRGVWREGVGELALTSPANCVYRALGRVIPSSFDPVEQWLAALHAAEGLRTLFNRQDATALLDAEYPGLDYWQAILRYCADGNLQAVLDEYVFQLRSQQPRGPITTDQLWSIADAMRKALSLNAVPLRAKRPGDEGLGLAMNIRFAVRYGGGRTEDGAAHRLPDVRAAFNSPFWPFVIASTSVGQEGIDFHWWSHSVIHWNVPTNPVDFEQREGRVHRYMGHAVRKNVAAAYGAEALKEHPRNPWEAMFLRAEDGSLDQPENAREFAPYWVHRGEHRIQRRLLDHPLSRDVPRTQRLLSGLAKYRLALGQARQDDLLETLQNTDMRALNLRP